MLGKHDSKHDSDDHLERARANVLVPRGTVPSRDIEFRDPCNVHNTPPSTYI